MYLQYSTSTSILQVEINEGVVESYVENVPIVLLFVCAVIVSPIFEELLFTINEQVRDFA